MIIFCTISDFLSACKDQHYSGDNQRTDQLIVGVEGLDGVVV
ncbi:MAG: hypothetical protein AAFZ92_03290 [Pseudomonadota bacterium]